MTCSPARLADNKANAARSTGPRTAEGKARSRSNAYKHGMTGAGVVLTGSEADEVTGQVDALGAGAEARPVLARRVAVLARRLDRLAQHEEAATARRLREAGVGDEARHREVDALVDRLADDPAPAIRQLRRTPEGCDRLIALWDDLARCLVPGRPWTKAHLVRAEALAGRRTTDLAPSDWALVTAVVWGDVGPLPPTADDPTGRDPARVASARADGRARLTGRIAEEVKALRDHRATLGEIDPDAARAEATALALFDPSPEAALFRRYEMATERGLYRALREIERPLPDPVPAGADESEAVYDPESEGTEEDASVVGSFGVAARAIGPDPSRPPARRPSRSRIAASPAIGPAPAGLAMASPAPMGLH